MNITPLTYLKYFYELCGSLYLSKYKSFFCLGIKHAKNYLGNDHIHYASNKCIKSLC